ncbi:MAG: DUF58 domain-containing protein [Armatimonadota bacterium]|nr:DUF58 domain-containing protein [Armatimonadota bacterium]MDR7550179.1 DUF58 domain-containing protein [Armatimonadota bacterium]
MPTREGWAVLVLAGAVFLLATNLMSGLLFVLDALLVSLFVVGAGSSVLPLRRLRVSREIPERGVEGAALPFGVTLAASAGGRFLVVEDGWPGARGRALVEHVAPGMPATATITVTPPQRGRYPVGPVEIASRGLLGLYHARRRLRADGHIVIWPQIRPVPTQVLSVLAPALDGQQSAGRSRQPDDLYGVREYQPGDSLARVHWRSSARRGTLVTREYQQAQAPDVTIVVDLDRRQSPARLDAAVRATASLLRAARERDVPAAVAGWAEGPVEHRGWEAAMDWLAAAAPCGPPVAEVLPHLARPGRALIVVAATADGVPPGAGVIPVVPAADAAAGQRPWGGLVYTDDGMVQAW